jgi:tetratricopeptide (TPR) repeat protein
MDDAPRRAALGRVLDYYLHTAHAATLLVNPSREPIGLAPAMAGVHSEQLAGYRQAQAWFEAEQHALLSAVTVAADAGFGVHAWQIAWTVNDFLEWRGLWLDLAAINHIALTAATRSGDIAGQATASRMIAYTSARAGDYDQARATLTECLALCHQAGHRGLEARVYQTLGWLSAQEGRYFDSLGHAEEALAVFRAIGDRNGEARALNNVGYSHLRLGDRRLARMFCEQAVLIQREEGSSLGEAIALDSLGDAEHRLGRHAEALDCYQRALGLLRDLGVRSAEAEVLVHLGDAQIAAGDPEQAQEAWQQAVAILDDLRHPRAGQVRRKLDAPAT